MRTMDEYLRLPYRMEIVPDTECGGYAVRFPELPGCLTCGDTLEDALRNAEDAKKTWIAAALEEGIAVPEPEKDEAYSGQFRLRMPKSLHRMLVERSREEGVSMNQYCVYLLAKNAARQ